MDSVFTKIINREIPSYIVKENEHYIAFLDAFPFVKGHTLVVPKIQTDQLFDLDDATYTGLMGFAKEIATGIKKAMNCERVGVLVEGIEVPHAHIHLFPMSNKSVYNFREKIKLSAKEFKAVQTKILNALI